MLLLLTFGLFGSDLRAELPPVAQLIRDAEAASEKEAQRSGEGPGWELTTLADAKAYVGDDAGAIRTPRPLASLTRIVSLNSCLEIQLQRAGLVRPGAPAPDKTGPGAIVAKDAVIAATIAEIAARTLGDEHQKLYRLGPAQTLAHFGKIAEGRELLPKDEEDPENAFYLTDFYLSAADYHAHTGDKTAAAESLRRAGVVAARWPKEGLTARLKWLEATLNVWIRMGNPAEARRACDAALPPLRDKIAAIEPRDVLDLWVTVARLHALTGDADAAREQFRDAIRMAVAAGPFKPEADPENPDTDPKKRDHNLADHAELLCKIANGQFAASFRDDADETYGDAATIAGQIVEAGTRDYAFSRLVELQSEAGNLAEALRTTERVQGKYWKALTYSRCAEKRAKSGDIPGAQALLDKAKGLAGDAGELNNQVHLMTRIAEIKSQIGDVAGARADIKRVWDLAEAAGDTTHRQQIARGQIRAGLLEEGYASTLAIEELRWRVQPLAELALAAAKLKAGK